MAEIRIDDDRARRMLKKAADRSADLRPVWGDVNANVVQPAMDQRFRSAGAHHGSKWAPLSPAGVRSRLRRGGNRGGISRPLWDTGRLRASWVKNGPESLTVMKPLSYERGTMVPYARFHQEGTGRLPARPMVSEELAAHVMDEAMDRIAAFIVDA